MNRWIVTVVVYHGESRGFPRVHRFAFDVRWLFGALLATGMCIGWNL